LNELDLLINSIECDYDLLSPRPAAWTAIYLSRVGAALGGELDELFGHRCFSAQDFRFDLDGINLPPDPLNMLVTGLFVADQMRGKHGIVMDGFITRLAVELKSAGFWKTKSSGKKNLAINFSVQFNNARDAVGCPCSPQKNQFPGWHLRVCSCRGGGPNMCSICIADHMCVLKLLCGLEKHSADAPPEEAVSYGYDLSVHPTYSAVMGGFAEVLKLNILSQSIRNAVQRTRTGTSNGFRLPKSPYPCPVLKEA